MEDKKPAGTLARVPDILASGKDFVVLLRDTTIFAVVVMLVLFPKTFNQRLVQAGFDKGTLMGMEWKSSLESSNATLAEAQKSISDLQEQNAELLGKLVAVGQKATDSGTEGADREAGTGHHPLEGRHREHQGQGLADESPPTPRSSPLRVKVRVRAPLLVRGRPPRRCRTTSSAWRRSEARTRSASR